MKGICGKNGKTFQLSRRNYYKSAVMFPKTVFEIDYLKIAQNFQSFEQIFSSSVERFYDVIIAQIPHFDLSIFYKNLETLSFEKKDSAFDGSAGKYVLHDN